MELADHEDAGAAYARLGPAAASQRQRDAQLIYTAITLLWYYSGCRGSRKLRRVAEYMHQEAKKIEGRA